jgi:ribosomal protein S18 acetylase RimI-like enzyme
MDYEIGLDKSKQVIGEPRKSVIENLKVVAFEGNASAYIAKLVRLDAICLGDYGAWTEENFLVDLPQKAKLSKLATLNGELVGYIVGSSYCGHGHIHRLAVSPMFERQGIAMRLLKEFSRACLGIAASQITVEASVSNDAANKFYLNSGFRLLTEEELKQYLHEKSKEAQLTEYVSDSKTRVVYVVETKKLVKG